MAAVRLPEGPDGAPVQICTESIWSLRVPWEASRKPLADWMYVKLRKLLFPQKCARGLFFSGGQRHSLIGRREAGPRLLPADPPGWVDSICSRIVDGMRRCSMSLALVM